MKVLILAFNYGNAGKYVNGPGICLFNLNSFCKDWLDIEIFVNIQSSFGESKLSTDINSLNKSIENCDILHLWSGLNSQNINAVKYANLLGKKVILGPNLIDGTQKIEESLFLNSIKYDKFLTVNNKLKFELSKIYNIDLNKLDILMVGPNIDTWKFYGERNGRVLWKDNCTHAVKDIDMARDVALKLEKYNIPVDIMGNKIPYDYFEHINVAKKYNIYYSTSYSETMGMALAEQWSAGCCSVTHPKIYLHGENYKTGIIVDRAVSSYVDAIREINDNKKLQNHLSCGAREYCESVFSKEYMLKRYMNILESK